jgi:hypothetical protein
MTSLMDSFFGLFCSYKSSRDIEPVVILPQEILEIRYTKNLPQEILVQILNLAVCPTRTALISKAFYEQSHHSYKILLKQYACYPYYEGPPYLAKLIASELRPAHKVKAIYQFILDEARSCGIDTNVIEPNLPLAPVRLANIRRLTISRLFDKFHVYRTIFNRLNRHFPQSFQQMTMQNVIEISEKLLKSHDDLYSLRPTKLDLGFCHLTYLPPLIGQLKALSNLNLHDNELTTLPFEMKSLTKLVTLHLNGNPLSSTNVKEICQSLPKLKTVFVDNQQPDLIEMFQTHFPDLQLQVVPILRMEEEI